MSEDTNAVWLRGTLRYPRTGQEALQRLRNLLDNEKNWRTGNWAADAAGNPCLYHDVSAVRFCMIGGLRRVCGYEHGGDYDVYQWARERLQQFLPERYNGSLVRFNDVSEHDQVLRLIDRALEERAP